MTNKYGTTDDWIDGDVLKADDLLDSIQASRQTTRILNQRSVGFSVHATGVWSALNGTQIQNTTDSAANWTNKYDISDTGIYMLACEADTTRAFAVADTGGGKTAYTADSGTTWTGKTVTPMPGNIYDLSFTTTGLVVVAGNDGAGANHIVYSTDNGGTWTDPTVAPSSDCYCVHMFDASTGYAVDSSGNIWKTTDGGDNWSDTTDNSNTAQTYMSIRAVSATACLIVTAGTVEYYDNSSNTVTQVISSRANTNFGIFSRVTGSGYFVAFSHGAITSDIDIAFGPASATGWNAITMPVKTTDTSDYMKKSCDIDGNFVYLSNDKFVVR